MGTVSLTGLPVRLAHRARRFYWRLVRPTTLGSRCLVLGDDTVLLVRHTYEPWWYLPGGGVKRGESCAEAARREAWEEAGLTLSRVVYLGYFVLTHQQTGVVRYAPTFIGEVQGIADVPGGTESSGMQMVNVEDVAACYFAWDDLLAAVFVYAQEEKQARLRAGMSVSALMGT